MMTSEHATAIVEALFRVLYDEPITNPERQARQMSTIANVICVASMPASSGNPMASIECQPLHDAYGQAKQRRGIK